MTPDYAKTKSIQYLALDVTTVTRGVVAHGVNCQGIMGSGAALAIRNQWLAAYEQYKKLCDAASDKGDLLKTVQIVPVGEDLYVANLFTQIYYGYDGRKYAELAAVKSALEIGLRKAQSLGLPYYMVKVGCQRGGLDWERDVEPFVQHLTNKYPDTDLYVCDL